MWRDDMKASEVMRQIAMQTQTPSPPDPRASCARESGPHIPVRPLTGDRCPTPAVESPAHPLEGEGFKRRAFLKTSALLSAGLVVACFIPPALRKALAEAAPPTKAPVPPNAFIHIAPDNRVTILLKHSEMGQGVWTSLPMVVAEELGCDWATIQVEHAPAAPAYAHTAFGLQMTGGSTSTWESFDQLRMAGAVARELLVAAAATKLGAKPADCRVERGYVVHGAKRVSFGEVAAAAAKLPTPTDVKLKDARDWTIIGKPTRRLDSFAKTTGRAEFGLDVKRPNMAVALVARAPVFGARLKTFDASKAKALPGVIDVVQVPSGVAVLGQHFWAAKQGRDALCSTGTKARSRAPRPLRCARSTASSRRRRAPRPRPPATSMRR